MAAISEDVHERLQVQKRKTKVCSVKYFQSHNNQTEKVSYFRPSPKIEQARGMIIGKEKLNSNFRVCSVHFEEKYIRKSLTFSTGQVFPLKKWSLLEDAIPTKHLDLPKIRKRQILELNENVKQNGQKLKEKKNKKQEKISTSKVITPDIDPLRVTEVPSALDSTDIPIHQDHHNAAPVSNHRSPTSVHSRSTNIETPTMQNKTNGECQTVGQPTNNSNLMTYISNVLAETTGNPKLQSSTLTDEMIKEIQDKVLLPSKDWHWLLNSETKVLTCVNHTQLNESQLLVKSVIVDNPSVIWYYVNGRAVHHLSSNKEFGSLRELWLNIRKFSVLAPCNGIQEETYNEL